jgi:hypothetical protein
VWMRGGDLNLSMVLVISKLLILLEHVEASISPNAARTPNLPPHFDD